MTENLHDKFTTLETQLSLQHTTIANALNAILEALGAPPPGPTTTLVDVVSAITQTNVILAGIRTDQADQATALLTVANALYSNTEIIIQNASTNTQAILAALYATFCACASDAPILAPPIVVTPTPLLTDEKCKRIQFYLSVFTNWLAKIGEYTATASFISGDVIGTLLGLAATEAGLVAGGAEASSIFGPPGVVIGAIVTLIAGAVYLIGSAVINTYLIQFSAPVFQHTLLEALYAANSADEGQSAFQSAVGVEFSAVPAGILSALWWTAWSNEMYSDTPVVDTSAFDGTICAPPHIDCFDANSVSWGSNGQGPWNGIEWASYSVATFSVSGGLTFTELNDATLNGWSITVLTSTDVVYSSADHLATYSSIFPVVIDLTSGALCVYSAAPFTIEVCPFE